MSVRIEQGVHIAVVTFDYDTEAVAIIKTVAGRQWDKTARHWTIPATSALLAAKRFRAAGFHVEGVTPTRTTSGDPLGSLLVATPPRLRTAVYKALARVLHPDAGGDHQLMQQLNSAYEDHK